MIDKDKLTEVAEELLKDTDCFLVDVKVSATNEIEVVIDSDSAVDIDECVALTRGIEAAFDRDVEDYELEVGSAGLTTPFKVLRQYKKQVGEPVEVITKEGKKLVGVLTKADENGFSVTVEEKVKHEGDKRPRLEEVPYAFGYDDVKSVVCHIEF